MAVPVTFGLFLESETNVTVASHDAVVSPALGNHVTIRTGPFLPNVRRAAGAPMGVDIVLGKTEASSIEEAVERYAFIASQPEAQVAIVTGALKKAAIDSALRGGLIALVPIGVWLLIGRDRRIQLLGGSRRRRIGKAGVAVAVGVTAVVVLVEQPWLGADPVVVDETEWISLQDYVPDIALPEEAHGIEIQGTLAASGTRRLVRSAVDTYQKSSTFYEEAVALVPNLVLREPDEQETVAVLVSDRHDNIGMDPVARAVADKAGATVVLDAGDDTSTGQSWEAFSLDSLNKAFEDYERYAIQGNHDHGGFVEERLAELGWTTATDGPVDAGPLGTIATFNDPRSSGLGNWRDQVGMSIAEMSTYIADVICGDEPVSTLMVHDINMGKEALARGCAKLVVAGHVHVQTGPGAVAGTNGLIGYRYTNGTTGGAAYAIAVGSKLRRAADISLITYREGMPVGTQVVTLQTNGVFEVGAYTPLVYGSPEGPPAPDAEVPEVNPASPTPTSDPSASLSPSASSTP